MPRGDRTGPMGAGPMTGRGGGYCAGYGLPGSANPRFACGRGLGMGRGARGGGRGWRHMFYATGQPGWARGGSGYAAPAAGQELEALKAQAKGLGEQLEAISRRIEELEG